MSKERSKSVPRKSPSSEKKTPTKGQQLESESITVAVRVRPLLRAEIEAKIEKEVKPSGNAVQVREVLDGDKSNYYDFEFENVLGEQSTQDSVFDLAAPVLTSVMNGINGTVMAYGQTSSGKTFTMSGSDGSNRGLIPRIIESLFLNIEQERESAPMHTDISYVVDISCLEIYNEKVFDLLGAELLPLPIRESKEGNFAVSGLSKHSIISKETCLDIITKATKNRATRATKQNEESSRSHSLTIIYLEKTVTSRTNAGASFRAFSKLNLVDLAGSEKYNDDAHQDLKKETVNINKSLSALNNVITKLAEMSSGGSSSSSASHIPYRDSILTRLLKDSLGGNSKALLVACICPSANNIKESLRTLRYASQAKGIKSKPKVNRTALVDYVKEMMTEVQLRQIFEKDKQDFLLNLKKQLDEMEQIVSKAHEERDQVKKNLSEAIEKINHLTEEKKKIEQEWEAKYHHLQGEFKNIEQRNVELNLEIQKLNSRKVAPTPGLVVGGAKKVVSPPGKTLPINPLRPRGRSQSVGGRSAAVEEKKKRGSSIGPSSKKVVKEVPPLSRSKSIPASGSSKLSRGGRALPRPMGRGIRR